MVYIGIVKILSANFPNHYIVGKISEVFSDGKNIVITFGDSNTVKFSYDDAKFTSWTIVGDYDVFVDGKLIKSYIDLKNVVANKYELEVII